jgi:hypothetical protein
MRVKLAFAFLALAVLCDQPRAFDFADGKLTLNGFGSWSYAKTNVNHFLGGEPGGNYENGYFALAVSARPADELIVAGQVRFLMDNTLQLDWAFAEWLPFEQVRVRLGKVKHPIGIYAEIADVGTLRPFLDLPQSVYGPAGIAGEGLLGGSASGDLRLGDWGMGWDAYAGGLDLQRSGPFLEPIIPGALSGVANVRTNQILGGRLALRPPVEGLELRASGFRGVNPASFGLPPATQVVYGVSIEYLTERISLRSEGFRVNESNTFTTWSGYVELGVFVAKHWQVAGRLDAAHAHTPLVDLPKDSPLLAHRELAFGVNYWIDPNAVVKLEYHDLDGNLLAFSDAGSIGAVERKTHLVKMGVQFSF